MPSTTVSILRWTRAFGGKRPADEPTVDRLDVLHASGALLGEPGR